MGTVIKRQITIESSTEFADLDYVTLKALSKTLKNLSEKYPFLYWSIDEIYEGQP